MATISLTIPDADVPRVIAAVCSNWPLVVQPLDNDGVPVVPNAANAKAMVAMWVRQCVREYETRVATQALNIDVTGLVS